MVRLLLENGPDVNVANDHGETPLHYSVHLKRLDLISAMLSYGADPYLKPKGHKSAYELAAELGDGEMLTLLNKAQELSDWLGQIDMKQYLHLFVKELVFKDVLPVLNEKNLTDLGITLAGDRLRILSAIQKLKEDKSRQGKFWLKIVVANFIQLWNQRKKRQ
jgi:ankyrin repeat protein